MSPPYVSTMVILLTMTLHVLGIHAEEPVIAGFHIAPPVMDRSGTWDYTVSMVDTMK